MRVPPNAVLAAGCVTASVLGEIASVALRWRITPTSEAVLWAVYNLGIVTIGALIILRLPGHRVGWLLGGLGTLSLLATDTLGGYGLRAEVAGWPGAAAAQWLSISAWSSGLLMWVLVLLHMPTGHVARRAWATIGHLAVLGTIIYLLGWLTSSESTNPDSAIANPFVVTGGASQIAANIGSVLLAVTLIGAMASVVDRARTADVVLRQQLKWVTVAGVLLVAFMPFGLTLWSRSELVRAATPGLLIAVVACLGAAVLRYRLFDVDRFILRALAYAAATALCIGLYAGVTIGLAALLGGGRSWQVAGATLIAASVFRPASRATQRIIDRRFDREHAARAQLDRYLDGLRAGTEQTGRFESVLREVTRTDGLRLLLRLPESNDFADVRGREQAPDPTLPTVELQSGGQVQAVAQYPPPTDEARSARIERMLNHSHLAVQVTRFGVELNRQVGALDASRRRIAVAADAERRRIQRDLHDGAQQRLVTVGIALRSVEARLRRRDEIADADLLDGLVADLQATLEELRSLVAQLPLPQLDGGIGAAFRELAVRSPIPVRVHVDTGRFDAAVEAVAYFVGSESLTNTLKHARATAVDMRAEQREGVLRVSVSDDGSGGAELGSGTGLLGLRDRVGAVGGRLLIESGPGRTCITAELPCA